MAETSPAAEPEAPASEPEPKAAETSANEVPSEPGEAPPPVAAETADTKADEDEAVAAGAKPDVAKANEAVAKAEEEADDEPPPSRRGDEDEMSLSSKFFRSEEDSVPPVDSTAGGHEEPEEVPAHLTLSPEAIARRARLRRVVGGVVALAALISVVVIGKSLTGAKKTVAEPAPVAVVAEKVEAAKPETPPAVAAPVASAAPTAAPSAEPEVAEPAASASAEAEPDVAAPSADTAALKKEALGLLNRGKRPEAIEASKRLIQAAPDDAMGYLYLGSALQESGKWKEGVEAYSECVRHATKGPVYECRAMGGKK